MDVKQLKALVTVVETGSVTRAAELLRLVQPAVTRQIRPWKTNSMYRCSTGPVRACAHGRRGEPADRARRALAELDRARAELAVTPST